MTITARICQQGINARLAIVGEALLSKEQIYKIKLKHFIQKMGMKEHVFFSGFRSDIPDILDAADAALLTSRYEGLPNVVVEAFLVGTPMVAYDVFGIAEILQHQETGYIVKQGDMDDAVSGLLQCFFSEKMKMNNISKNRDAISDLFRKDRMIQQKMHFYEKIFSSFLSGN